MHKIRAGKKSTHVCIISHIVKCIPTYMPIHVLYIYASQSSRRTCNISSTEYLYTAVFLLLLFYSKQINNMNGIKRNEIFLRGILLIDGVTQIYIIFMLRLPAVVYLPTYNNTLLYIYVYINAYIYWIYIGTLIYTYMFDLDEKYLCI